MTKSLFGNIKLVIFSYSLLNSKLEPIVSLVHENFNHFFTNLCHMQ